MSSTLQSIKDLKGQSFLITGGDGNLASAFAKAIVAHVPNSLICNPGKAELDVSNVDSFRLFEDFNPDIVIHCAAKVDADFCETNPLAAQKIIVDGTKNVIDFANSKGAKLFYPQSFLIFDGSQNPTHEAPEPNPLSEWVDFMEVNPKTRILWERFMSILGRLFRMVGVRLKWVIASGNLLILRILRKTP